MICPNGYYRDVKTVLSTGIENLYALIETCPSSENIPLVQYTGPNIGLINVPLSFSYDIFSIAPVTGYSWTFEGGTPATSSAESPSVTWTEVGDHTITLSVSNENGSSELITRTISIMSLENGFSYDFEGCEDFIVDQFAPCTTYDGDGKGTYGINGTNFTNQQYTGAYIAFNPSQTTPALGTSWAAHGGNKYGACFAATTPPNNDWFIFPQIRIGTNGTVKFWAKSLTDQYGMERFNVLVSTTDNTITSFTKISTGNYTQAPTTWTQYSYDLSTYKGQDIYIAIQCVSHDAFAFLIDDIEVAFDSNTEEPTKIVTYSEVNAAGGTLTATVNGATIASGEEVEIGEEVIFTAIPNVSTDEIYKVKEWKLDGAVVEGNTTNEFVTTIGESDINVTVEFELDKSGILEELASTIKIYPNPTSDILNINNITGADIQIVNLLGQIVSEEYSISETHKVNVSSLDNGTYVVKVILGESTLNYRVVIAR